MTRLGDFDTNVVPYEQALRYAEALEKHILHVQRACSYLGVPTAQMLAHDESKYSEEEFAGYALQFGTPGANGVGMPVRAPKATNPLFVRAWLHHIHVNPHHWQFWLFPDGWSPPGSELIGGAMEMPPEYILEMVADWLGAGRAYTGQWNMTDWLKRNLPSINLHPRTRSILDQCLARVDYEELQRRFE